MRLPPRWLRRVLAPLLVGLIAVLGLLLLPGLLVVALVASIFLPGDWRGVRLLGFGLVWVAVELVALTAAFGLWVATGAGLLMDTRWSRRAHYAVLGMVLDAAVDAAEVIFKLRLVMDGESWTPLDDGIPGSPRAMIVLSRHAGPGDSILMVQTLLNRHHRRQPRLVLKAALQFDPMIDVFFNRLPAHFVDSAADQEESVGVLAGGMGDRDALLIYPEGGNFTPRRRRRAIQWLRHRGLRRHADAAERMHHVLPPRPGGVLAAMAAAPSADLVFVAHTGLDHMVTMADIWRAVPQHKTLKQRWWIVPAADVPVGHEERISWLYDRWEDIDGWIEAHREEPVVPGADRGGRPS